MVRADPEIVASVLRTAVTFQKLGVVVMALCFTSGATGTVWVEESELGEVLLPVVATATRVRRYDLGRAISLKGVVETFEQLLRYAEDKFGDYDSVAVTLQFSPDFPAIFFPE